MVKICLDCKEVCSGGYRCVDCGGELIMTDDPKAKDMPESVWKSQRVDYGARRGMVMRFAAIFIGSFVGLYLLRQSVVLPRPYSLIGGALAVFFGIGVWGVLYILADRGVKIWVKEKGRVHKLRLAKAALGQVKRSVLPSRGRRRRA